MVSEMMKSLKTTVPESIASKGTLQIHGLYRPLARDRYMQAPTKGAQLIEHINTNKIIGHKLAT